MAEILKMLELAQNDRVAEVQVGSGRIHAELDAQRFAGGARLLQLGPQIFLADNFCRTFFEIRELFVYRCEGWHGNRHYKECGRQKSEQAG